MEAIRSKILSTLNELSLDLHGKTVLTEAATGAYSVTAVVAALAGAEVFAVAKPTRFGSAEDAFNAVKSTAALFGDVDIHFIEKISEEQLKKADILTNSGHVRPLDKEKLSLLKPGSVIPLMYEAWEFRSEDLDLDFCKSRNIRVVATNERHPGIDVFNYLGDMAMKFIFDAGLSLQHNTFILLCNNDFGPFIAKVLAKNCKTLGIIDIPEHRKNYELSGNTKWLSDFPELKIPSEFKDADAVLFTAYPFDKNWIGNNGSVIDVSALKDQLDHPFVLRYCGDADAGAMKSNGIKYYPEDVKSGHMGILPSEIGWDPIIRLQAGGLKAAELGLKNENMYKGILLSEKMN